MTITTSDWIAVTFGVIGFAVSVVTLIRSIQTDANVAAQSMKQLRLELLNVVIQAETASMLASEPFEEIAGTARNLLRAGPSASVQNVLDSAEQALALIRNRSGAIRTAQLVISKDLPPKAEWKRTAEVMESMIVHLKPQADLQLVKADDRELVDKMRECLSIERLNRESARSNVHAGAAVQP